MKVDVSDLIGIPYKEHGRDNAGYDCYGLTIEVVRRYGKTLPDVVYSAEHDISLSDENTPLLPLRKIDEVEEGCLIEMRYRGELHIGVYIGNKRFIHATRGQGVRLSRLGNIPAHAYWRLKG